MNSADPRGDTPQASAAQAMAPPSQSPHAEGGLQRRRTNPLGELIATEARYVLELSLAIERVAGAWTPRHTCPREADTLFRALELVHRTNADFLRRLQDIGPNPASPKGLGNLLMRWVDQLQDPYANYAAVYMTGFNTYPAVLANRALPATLASVSQELPKSAEQHAWTLDDFFELPLQRLRFYKKLYQRLLRSTQSGRSDHRLLVRANEKLEALVQKAQARQQVHVGQAAKSASAATAPTPAMAPSPVMPTRPPPPQPAATAPGAAPASQPAPTPAAGAPASAAPPPTTPRDNVHTPKKAGASPRASPAPSTASSTAMFMAMPGPGVSPVKDGQWTAGVGGREPGTSEPAPSAAPSAPPHSTVPPPLRPPAAARRNASLQRDTPGEATPALSPPMPLSPPAARPLGAPTTPAPGSGKPSTLVPVSPVVPSASQGAPAAKAASSAPLASPAPKVTLVNPPTAPPAAAEPAPAQGWPAARGPAAPSDALPKPGRPGNSGGAAAPTSPPVPILVSPVPSPEPRTASPPAAKAPAMPSGGAAAPTRASPVLASGALAARPSAGAPAPGPPAAARLNDAAPAPGAPASHDAVSRSIESQPLPALQQRIDASHTIDVFTLEPKMCRLLLLPPSLPFERRLRAVDYAQLRIQTASGQQKTVAHARLILLTDLLLIAEDVAPSSSAPPKADLRLLFPPLSGRFIEVHDPSPGAPASALRLSIMQRVDLLVTSPRPEFKARWLRELHACKSFGQQMSAPRSPRKDAAGATSAARPPPPAHAPSAAPPAGPPAAPPAAPSAAPPTAPPVGPGRSMTPKPAAAPERKPEAPGAQPSGPSWRPPPGVLGGPASTPDSHGVASSPLAGAAGRSTAPSSALGFMPGPGVPTRPTGAPPGGPLGTRAAPPPSGPSAPSPSLSSRPLLPHGAPPPPPFGTAGRGPPSPAHGPALPPGMPPGVASPNTSLSGTSFVGAAPGPSPANSNTKLSSRIRTALPPLFVPSTDAAGNATDADPSRVSSPITPAHLTRANSLASQESFPRVGPRRVDSPDMSGSSITSRGAGAMTPMSFGAASEQTLQGFQPLSGPLPPPGVMGARGSLPRASSMPRLRDAALVPPSQMKHDPDRRHSTEWMQDDDDDAESVALTDEAYKKQSFHLCAQMRCKVFLKHSYAQWRSLGSARLRLYHLTPSRANQLVVENDKKVIISSIVLPIAVERFGKTGLAVELSDQGRLTGIVYMLHMRSEESANGLFQQLLAGSGRSATSSPVLSPTSSRRTPTLPGSS